MAKTNKTMTTRQRIIQKVGYAIGRHDFDIQDAWQTYDHGGVLTAAEKDWVIDLDDNGGERRWKLFVNAIKREAQDVRDTFSGYGRRAS